LVRVGLDIMVYLGFHIGKNNRVNKCFDVDYNFVLSLLTGIYYERMCIRL